MICVVVLQNCMDVMEGETGNCSGTGVTCDDDGTEEVSMEVEDAIDIKEEFSIKVEDAEDIKDEIPEPITFTTIKTEQEVRLCGVCVGGSSCFQSMYFIYLWQFEGKMP